MLPTVIPMFIVPRIVTHYLAHRFSGRDLLTAGLSLVCLGLFALVLAVRDVAYGPLIGGMVITGVGAGLLNGETTKVGMTVIPRERSGMAARARQVLDVCSTERAEMRANDLTETIALGVMPSIPIQKISAITKACVAAFPEASFDFREGHSAELHDMRSKGRLDLAFASALSDVDDPRQARLMQEHGGLPC
jgi:hypothetical protein